MISNPLAGFPTLTKLAFLTVAGRPFCSLLNSIEVESHSVVFWVWDLCHQSSAGLFWKLCYLPLVYWSILAIVPHCLDYIIPQSPGPGFWGLHDLGASLVF